MLSFVTICYVSRTAFGDLHTPMCVCVCVRERERERETDRERDRERERDLGFPSGSVVKNLPEMQEMWVQSLCWEESLEKEIATPSSILAWRIPWTEEPGELL